MPVRMAESGSTPSAGDKRPADSKAEEKRPPKVRRFDMKTKVPKARTTDSTFSASSEKKDGIAGTEKSIIVTTVIKKSESSRTVCDTGALTTERAVEASQRLQSADKSDVSSHGAHKTQPSSSVPDAMSVNRMLQTSLGLPQTETGSGHKEERSQGYYHKNIVDQLFQEFVSTKMREVDDRLNAASGEDSAKTESEKNPVSESIEEMSRLLDAEITSIKSRNVVASLAVEDVVWSGINSSEKTQADHQSMDQSNGTFAVPYVSDRVWDSGSEQSQPSAPTLSMVEISTESAADAGETASKETTGSCGVEGAGLVVRKKLEVKKLGLSIRPESLARITGHANNGRTLEDGEVASSTDSDGEKAFLKTEQVVAETEDSGEVSGTGSLSDSDRGKDGKAKKKKKKHKHKHKKKKKHKSQSKEKEKEEEEEKSSTHSKERRSSKDKKERKGSQEEKSDRKSSKERKEGDDPSKKDSSSKESKSKEGKKSSHPKSKSPEAFDPWDARNYRMDGSKAESPSPSKSRHRSRSQDRHTDRSKDRPRQRSKERHHHKRSREHSRKRSRSREKEKGASEGESAKDKDLRVKIDKNKLRKIAIARALSNMEKGKGPSVDLTLAKSGGKSVAELTEFCKRISEKETAKDSSESEVSEEEKSDAEDSPFHHPFIMRDSSAPIVMNIRNAKQLPVLTPQEKQTQAATLRSQFPVSSGTQHRSKESEWVPVTTTSTATTTGKTMPVNATAPSAVMTTTTTVGSATGTTTAGGGGGQTEMAMLAAPVAVAAAAAAVPAVESVFPSVQGDISIGSIILERVQAMRRLQQNPFDLQALNSVHRINEQTNAWAQSCHLPGQFTGTTDIKILTQEELAGPDRRNQAWARKVGVGQKKRRRRAEPLWTTRTVN